MNERKLTKSELAKREDIIMKMKKNKRALTQKYGKDAEAVMYGRATKLAKKQAESMDQDKIKELVKDALQNPKKADLNKDGKLSDYEKKRGAAIEKAMVKELDLDLKGGTEKDKDADIAGVVGAEDVLGLEEGFYGSSDIEDVTNALGYSDPYEFFQDNPGAINALMDWVESVPEFRDMLKDADLLQEGASTEEKRIAMRAIKSIAKYRGVSNDEARNDLIRATKEIGDLNEENIGLADLEEKGYEAGEKSAYTYGTLITKLQNRPDKLAFKKGFVQGVIDELGSNINEDLNEGTDLYEKDGFQFTRFSGGKEDGPSLQITTDKSQYIQIPGKKLGLFMSGLEKAVSVFDDMSRQLPVEKSAFQKRLDKLAADEKARRANKPIGEDMDLGHQDNEPHMLKADLYRIGKYAMELYQMVDGFEGQGEVDFPHWWQSKVIRAKDMLVGAKHYLDFEVKEPQIDAMVDVAAEEDVIDENAIGINDRRLDDKQKSALDLAVRGDSSYSFGNNPYADDQLRYKYAVKMGFLEEKKEIKEGVWSLGSAKSIKNIIGILDIALDIKDPQELMDLMDMHDKSMYNIVGDDVFHDDIDGAKRELAQNNLDRAYNRLIDAKGRAEDLFKIASENDLKDPSIFEGIAKKLAKQLKSVKENIDKVELPSTTATKANTAITTAPTMAKVLLKMYNQLQSKEQTDFSKNADLRIALQKLEKLASQVKEGLPKGYWDKKMDAKDEVSEDYDALVNKVKKQDKSEKAAKAIAGAVASYKAKGGGKGPTAKQKARG